MRAKIAQSRRPRGLILVGLLASLTLGILGCESPSREVTVYTALDEEFSRPIFDAFTRKTGVVIRAKYDTESTKTLNLAQEVLAERDRPRCDLYWNNEPIHTLRLAQQGLFRRCEAENVRHYPPEFRDPAGEWVGFAARARVLLVNTNLVAEARRPDSIEDLLDPQWHDRVGVAKPLFGSTATHAACLFTAWGEERAAKFFRGVKRNARILSGNRQVARAVASGSLYFGLTDTDDAMIEIEAGHPVAIIYPDQQEYGLGTLFFPNTVAVLRGSPHPHEADQLLNFLLSSQIEGRLAMGPSAQIPLNAETKVPARVETPKSIRAMKVDFGQAAEVWKKSSAILRDLFAVAN